MQYNTCACGLMFLAEGCGPAYRLCNDCKTLPLPDKSKGNLSHRPHTKHKEETKDKVRRMYEAGETPQEIITKIGIAQDTVYKWIRDWRKTE